MWELAGCLPRPADDEARDEAGGWETGGQRALRGKGLEPPLWSMGTLPATAGRDRGAAAALQQKSPQAGIWC